MPIPKADPRIGQKSIRDVFGRTSRDAKRDEGARHERLSRGKLVVVGAGIVGLCSALSLQRAGAAVTILDPLPPGMGASFGNAGFLSADQNVPLALPGMWRQVPGWLLDPLGPLVVRPSYLPTAAPWLARWLLASRMKSVAQPPPTRCGRCTATATSAIWSCSDPRISPTSSATRAARMSSRRTSRGPASASRTN